MEIQRLEKEGVMYYELRVQCPICRSHGVTTPNYSYKHFECGGQLMLGDNALIYCSECEETLPLNDGIYTCPKCKGEEIEGEDLYIHLLPNPHIHEFSHCLALAGLMVQVAGKEWLIRCMQHLTTNNETTDETTEG